MARLLWLIPCLPLAGFALLIGLGSRLPRRRAAWIGCGSIALSALCALACALAFLPRAATEPVWTQTLWRWIDTPLFSAGFGLHLDALSLVMVLVVTFVGFLIHLYSSEFMADDPGFSRFFAYMNLFVGAMLLLLLADNLLFLYLGWEGVGLCSYLLIGFWYKDPANGRAARKAFIVTRVGDTAMALGLFLLAAHCHTLHIATIAARAPHLWAVGSSAATVCALLLLGGAMGKSAQLPLQTWLPDAMAGPTPVSALIHAATMVTAGVYLIARTNVLFTLAPAAMTAVAVVGTLTLLLAGAAAVVQHDIKRVLAYSTISQIGYMFLALGVGAWSAALFHFMTHAFFKALLFLGAGAVIHALHHEHNIFRMGGLARKMPLVFLTFGAGAAALAALPLVSAGFYSKDQILWQVWSAPGGGRWLWAGALAGALLTAFYTARLVFLVFFGPAASQVEKRPGWRMNLPLLVLAVLSIVGGLVELPHNLGHVTLFSDLLHTALPEMAETDAPLAEMLVQWSSALAVLLGVFLAYYLYLHRRSWLQAWHRSTFGGRLHGFLQRGWGFDTLYDTLFVRPLLWFCRVNAHDAIDAFYLGVARMHVTLHGLAATVENGAVRRYATVIALGAALLIAGMVFL